MARGIHTRKRSAGGAIKRSSKKRRVTSRRRRKSSGRSTTTRASNATSVGTFRGRKTSLSTYRNMLWRDSLMKTHYRSVFDATASLATPNNVTQSTFVLIPALPVFYTGAGGLQVQDSGVTPPLFVGDVILRGGYARLAVANRPDPLAVQNTDNVRVTVYAVWTTAAPTNPAGFPGAVPTMWDPSLVPDFEKFGKVMWKKEALLKSDGEAVQFYFKFKVQKIDQAIFNAGTRGQTLYWMLLISQMTNTEAAPTPENVDYLLSHNLSFSADAVGTT